jgi:hypothetical protein
MPDIDSDIHEAILRAVSNPRSVTTRAKGEIPQLWIARAVKELAEPLIAAAERERLACLLDAEADSRYNAASASSGDGLRPPNGGHVAAGGAYEHAAEIVRGASS